jgi:hypothetical protein
VAPARRALHAGEERGALAAAFTEFERLVAHPYQAGQWDDAIADMPAAKRKELAK